VSDLPGGMCATPPQAPQPSLTPDEVRHLLAECVTVVKPGETLVIRVPVTWSPEQVREYGEYLSDAARFMELPFTPIVVAGDELAVAGPPESDADFIARLERVFPELSRRQMRREAMKMPGQARPAYPS
jgi:hypothetical protein